MRTKFFLVFTIILFAGFLTACEDLANQIVGATDTPEPAPTATTSTTDAPPANTPTSETIAEPTIAAATVDSIEILMMESFPVQVSVRARGELPDGCTEIDQVNTFFDGASFNVSLLTLTPAGPACGSPASSFEEVVPLDVEGLAAGTYTVDVNGITGSFTLDVDNVLGADTAVSEEASPTPTETTDSNSAIINGRVWHDLCAIAGGEGDTAVIPSAGCVAASDGNTYEANGLLEDGEPGLEGVLVDLGAGDCPATGLATATTDEAGDFVFDALPAGNYCVSINPDADENAFLVPGVWTYPGIGETAVTLTDGEVKTGVNFGWDYEFLPTPEIDLENCTNSIAFVADLSYPDDTVVAPGETFEKGWELRNTGTCPWTPDYSLVFAGGDQMSATTPISLTGIVAPDQEVSVFVTFTAPEEEGTYRSDWVMADANGTLFGVDGFADQVFWVQIVVGIPEATPEPNSAAIGGVVWEDICFLDEDGNPSAGCVEIEGTGFYRGDGTLINEPRLAGITVLLAEGACPDDGVPDESDILQTTVTDENGLYRFLNLDEGLYCVAIDALAPENVDLLIPGNWTWPAPGTGRQGINLTAGAQQLEIDFGWDYQE